MSLTHKQIARLAMTGKVMEAAELLHRHGLIDEPPAVIVKRFTTKQSKTGGK